MKNIIKEVTWEISAIWLNVHHVLNQVGVQA